jgi:hypothetical protein
MTKLARRKAARMKLMDQRIPALVTRLLREGRKPKPKPARKQPANKPQPEVHG